MSTVNDNEVKKMYRAPMGGGEIMKKKNLKNKGNRKIRRNLLKVFCWGIAPAAVIVLLVLDGLGIYVFNNERLIVLGIGLLTVLLPFFSEVKVKDVFIKRDDT